MHPRALLASAALVGLLLAPAGARADHYFLFPQVGVGYGRVAEAGFSKPGFSDWVGKLDLMLGQEYDLGGPRGALGWMVDLAYTSNFTDSSRVDAAPSFSRFEFAPMLTLSSGYNWFTWFARVGVGPHFALTKIGDDQKAGGGAQIDLAVGSKDIIELYTEALGTVDGRGASLMVTGGVRLNVIIFVALVELFSGSSRSGHHDFAHDSHSHEHGPPESGPHEAKPIH